MRIGAALVMVIGIAGTAQAVAAPMSDTEVSRAMQGCWNQTGWSDELNALAAENGVSVSTQLCLKGGVKGTVTELACSTQNDLTECSTSDGQYAFHDEKFWQDFDGVASSCDVLLEGRKALTLKNCDWIDPPPAVEPIDDAVYAKAER
jgi:hypothetical protein